MFTVEPLKGVLKNLFPQMPTETVDCIATDLDKYVLSAVLVDGAGFE